MNSDFVDLNGHSFHLHSWGPPSAPAMLMLHGFPEFGGAWAEVTALLPEWRCIAPDQRGFGQSWAPPEILAYDLRSLVGDMAALIEQLGAPLPVVAHDWGAIIAYALAMWRPDLVSQLIVVNGVHPGPFQRETALGGPQSVASQYINSLRVAGAEDDLSRDDFLGLRQMFSAKMDMSWLSGQVRDAYRREWQRPGVMTGMLNWYRASPLQVANPGEPLNSPYVLTPQQGHISCPHLVVWGADDTALLSSNLEGLDAYCTDLTIRKVEGADHWICHQKPGVVAEIIRAWLSDH